MPEGTRLTQLITVEPKGFLALMAPMLKTMMKNRMRVIASEIQAYLVK